MSTYMSYAYLDMSIRCYTNIKMHDVHLLNFLTFEKQTSEVLFTSMSQVLDKVCEDWIYKIIGITMYTLLYMYTYMLKKNMTGRINGFYK